MSLGKLKANVQMQASKANKAEALFESARQACQLETAHLFSAQWVFIAKQKEHEVKDLQKKEDRNEALQEMQRQKLASAERQSKKGLCI